MSATQISSMKKNCKLKSLVVQGGQTILIEFCVRFSYCRENEKNSQRENLWQQVECLAKTNSVWPNIAGKYIWKKKQIKWNAKFGQQCLSDCFILQLYSTADVSEHNISFDRAEQMKKIVSNKDRPLLRTKSELPHDTDTILALKEHRRVDDYLQTNPDDNKC